VGPLAARRTKVVVASSGSTRYSHLASCHGMAGFLRSSRRLLRQDSKCPIARPLFDRASVRGTYSAPCLTLTLLAFATLLLFQSHLSLVPAVARSVWRSRSRAPSRSHPVAA